MSQFFQWKGNWIPADIYSCEELELQRKGKTHRLADRTPGKLRHGYLLQPNSPDDARSGVPRHRVMVVVGVGVGVIAESDREQETPIVVARTRFL